jgi:pimeloyl-[acyl-carrier protein] synthase
LSRLPEATFDTYASVLRRQLDLMDPPRHTELRQLYSKAFSSERLACAKTFATHWLGERLRTLPRSFDVIGDVARPLPLAVVLDFVGLPEYSRQPAHHAVAQFVAGLADPATSHTSVSAALESLRRLLRAAIDTGQPATGSLLEIAHKAASHGVDFEDIVALTILTIAAGHETTTNVIGNGTWLLLAHPGQRSLVSSQPGGGWSSAIEEILRLESPVQTMRRMALDAIEISGQRIHPGREVILSIGKANRDPTTFIDPDRFDVWRSPNRHLAFGLGGHFCLGAQLARQLAHVALETILSLPSLRAIDREPVWIPSSAHRGLERLCVEWDSGGVSG